MTRDQDKNVAIGSLKLENFCMVDTEDVPVRESNMVSKRIAQVSELSMEGFSSTVSQFFLHALELRGESD